MERKEIVITIIVASLLVVILCVFILLFFLLFTRKKRRMQREKEILKSGYERALLQSQLEIQEQTFNSISQEIHDNVGQVLSLAKVQVSIIEQGQPGLSALKEVKESITIALNDLRDIARSLNGQRILQMGLKQAVEKELERINNAGILKARLVVTGNVRKVHSQKKLILFRIVQECIQNIIKHADATQMEVFFDYRESHLRIKIKDNGKGFDMDEHLHSGGLGLQNITERASVLGGATTIRSTDGEGTIIELNIPYE
jgi:two-component system NarL family sensor kinase